MGMKWTRWSWWGPRTHVSHISHRPWTGCALNNEGSVLQYHGYVAERCMGRQEPPRSAKWLTFLISTAAGTTHAAVFSQSVVIMRMLGAVEAAGHEDGILNRILTVLVYDGITRRVRGHLELKSSGLDRSYALPSAGMS